ncbi:hypothetical protein PSCICO_24640 [Pseudomonas cichorii]|nr:hypothetical protein PSCICM_29590 [Pseudomonas cichorii]GFM87065.1 hypothetical protein PSCICO_24640 [Pseudomonas cichorii]
MKPRRDWSPESIAHNPSRMQITDLDVIEFMGMCRGIGADPYVLLRNLKAKAAYP